MLPALLLPVPDIEIGYVKISDSRKVTRSVYQILGAQRLVVMPLVKIILNYIRYPLIGLRSSRVSELTA